MAFDREVNVTTGVSVNLYFFHEHARILPYVDNVFSYGFDMRKLGGVEGVAEGLPHDTDIVLLNKIHVSVCSCVLGHGLHGDVIHVEGGVADFAANMTQSETVLLYCN